MQLRPDDIVLMLDSAWETPQSFYDEAYRSGCYIAQVVYDLLPVTHPEFFAPSITASYNRWLQGTLHQVHGYWSISHTVRDELRGHCASWLRVSRGARGRMRDATSSRWAPT